MTQLRVIQNRIGLDGRTRVLAFLLSRLAAADRRPSVTYFECRSDTLLGSHTAEPEVHRQLPRVLPKFHGHLADQARLAPYAILPGPGHLNLFHDGPPLRPARSGTSVGNLICASLPETIRRDEKLGVASPLAAQVLRAVLRLYNRTARGTVHLAVNSRYTRSVVAKDFAMSEGDIAVLYPPIAELEVAHGEATIPPTNASTVAVLGRVRRDKIDLPLIRTLLASNPGLQIKILGQIDDQPFAETLRGLSRQVDVYEGLSDRQLAEQLRAARVLLHMKQYEHFGIAPLEGVMHGCVPVTHDSGGCRETVPLQKLRYENADDAARIINELLRDDEVFAHGHQRCLAHLDANFTERAVQDSYDRYLRDLLQ